MSRGIDWYRRPEVILGEMIDKVVEAPDRTYYRAVVLAVDLDGGKLQNTDGSGEMVVTQRDGTTKKVKAIVGPPNPRGSVKARILTDGYDRLLDDNSLRVYWPMFPQDLSGTPATPGEHVYVMFDGQGTSHGLWVTRVAGHESANSFLGTTSYDAPSAPQTAMDSFEGNPAEYPKDETHAGLAPSQGAMSSFEEE